MGSARTMLPRDLLILSFSKSSQPCAKMRLRQRDVAGHQERGPEDGVEAENFLADEMQIGGPEAVLVGRAVDGADVADQRVEPDVGHVFAFERNAPFDGGAGDRKVLQTAAHEADDFVAARFGLDEIGIVLVMLQQLVREGRELEEVILFGDGFGGASAVGAVSPGLASLT